MKKLLFLTVFVSLFLGATLSHAQTPPAPVYDFDYQLVALDASTHGVITSDTNRIELGVIIENHSLNVPQSEIQFSFQEGNLVTGRGLLIQALETNNTLILGFPNFIGSKFIYADVNPTTMSKLLPNNDVILGDLRNPTPMRA